MRFSSYIVLLAVCLWLLAPQRASAQETVLYPDTTGLSVSLDDPSLVTIPIRVLNFTGVFGVNTRITFGGGVTVDSAYFAPGINALPGSFLVSDDAVNLVFIADVAGLTVADGEAFFFVQFRLPGNSDDCFSITFEEMEGVLVSDTNTAAPFSGVDVECLLVEVSLSGTMTYAVSGTPLAAVSLELLTTEDAVADTTDEMGQYQFGDLTVPEDYTLLPLAKTDETERADRLRGINILDMIVMQRHILGTAPFSSPYQHIAADINANGQVTVADLIALQGYLLARTDDFPDNTYWRFIDAEHVFDPMNPLQAPYPELISTGTLLGSRSGLDFIGLKVGDANLDAY